MRTYGRHTRVLVRRRQILRRHVHIGDSNAKCTRTLVRSRPTQSPRLFAWWLGMAVLTGIVSSAPAQNVTERASLSASAGQGSGDSDQVSISGDGRYVAFRSAATNLIVGDTNGVTDVFVRDRWTGLVERISVSSLGVEATAESMEPNISYDGRFVVFASEANDLALDIPSGSSKDIFVRDRIQRTTRTVTMSAAGGASNGDCHRPRVSSDGRYVTFEGSPSNLIAAGTTNYQVFRRDMTAATVLVSVNLSGSAGAGFSWNGGVSGDGRFVVFVSNVANLVTPDTNGNTDAFVRDVTLGLTRLVTVSSAGVQGTGAAFINSSISRDGRWVAYASSAPNLAPGEFGASYDIFVHDLLTLQTFRSSVTSSGAPANQNSYDPAISDDGRYVAFQSFATNLDPLDTDMQSDVFLRDRTLATTKLLSRSVSTSSNDDSFSASITAEGDQIAFHSESTDLVPADTNLRVDAFVRDLGSENYPVFCAGLTTTCPCANSGLGSAGCANSTTSGGALLRAFGRASLIADQVTLLATGLPPATSALFFQGTNRENGGAGTSFGDGSRCASGTVVRLATYPVVAGTAAIGFGGTQGLGGGTTTPIHTLGLVTGLGGTRLYQAWYRNSATFCTSALFNLSNGVEILWQP